MTLVFYGSNVFCCLFFFSFFLVISTANFYPNVLQLVLKSFSMDLSFMFVWKCAHVAQQKVNPALQKDA